MAQVFSCEFCENSKNTFLKNTSRRLLLKQHTYFIGIDLKCSIIPSQFNSKKQYHFVFADLEKSFMMDKCWNVKGKTGVNSFHSTLSWRRTLSYRNQSTDLFCKSMDWFLYEYGLRDERVKFKLTPRFKKIFFLNDRLTLQHCRSCSKGATNFKLEPECSKFCPLRKTYSLWPQIYNRLWRHI